MSSIGSNHGIFSTHTARTLKTEHREQEPKTSFWASFGKLTLGQKVGRIFANLGAGGVVGAGAGAGAVYGLGLGLGLATGGIALAGLGLGMLGFWAFTAIKRHGNESARVARQEECRPRENRVLNSTDTVVQQGEDGMDTGIPMKNTTVLGAEARKECAKALMEHVVADGVLREGPAAGLSGTFLADLHRADFSIQTSDGNIRNFGRSEFLKKQDRLDTLTDAQKSAVIERDFKQVIAGDPALEGDQEKISRWQVVASQFMHQTSPIKAQGFAFMASNLQITEGENYLCKYNLRFEPGGNSAILECIETGGVNGINKMIKYGDQIIGVEGHNWDVEKSAVETGIDKETSSLEKITVLRITLEDPQVTENDIASSKAVADGMGVEVLSHSSSYKLRTMSREKYDATSERVNNPPLIVEQQAPEGLTDVVVDSLIRRLDGGSLFEADAQRITQLKSELLEGKRLLEFEKLGIFAKHLFTTPLTPGEKFQLIRLLEGAFDSKGGNAFMDLMSDGKLDEMNPAQIQKLREEMVPSVGIATAYPWAVNNTLASTGATLVSGERDFDLQNFAHRKIGEKVAREELGISGEEFYQLLKAELGPSAVMTAGFLDSEKLHPISAELRDELLEDFNRAGTLDEFYAMAETRIQVKKQEAERVLARTS
jgi:hypothetical protein